ncbi:MAG: hypothetical protein IKU81_05970 [Oscillibacter sp.]|nr:hypothetical protein [Oscillibacter sp.]
MNKGEILMKISNWSSVSEEGKVLHDINFDLRAGETHAILSTSANDEWGLVHLFQNKIRSSSGECFIAGVSHDALKDINKSIQVMETETAVSQSISPVEQIFLSARMPFFAPRQRMTQKCFELMRETGLHVDLNKRMADMTGDELRRVEILHICAMLPPVAVFLDSMTFLGEETRVKIPGVLDWLRGKGCGVIYITNNFEDALRLSDRISVFDNGTVKGTFLTENVRKDPREVASLLSGWRKITQIGSSSEAISIMESIANMGDMVTSDYELKRVLEYILKDMEKALDASGVVIYMMDDDRFTVMDADPSARKEYMTPATVAEVIARGEDAVWRRGDPAPDEVFDKNNVVELMLCYPLHFTGNRKALVQAIFTHARKDVRQLSVYAKMFVKEISIAIETSRLLGKSVLLQESHHRIKNNLQTIVNLLYLQKPDGSGASERYVRNVLETAINRVKSIAYVHSLLCRDWYGKNVVNLKNITQEIVRLYETEGVTIQLELEDVSLPYDNAVSMALVINELISNCIKHAFSGRSEGNVITVITQNTGMDIKICVRDNGVGIQEDFNLDRTDSVGISIVKSIVASLHGELRYCRSNGTETWIYFRRPTIMPVVSPELNG